MNEYQRRLERQRQVWLIAIADECVGVQVNCEIPWKHVPYLSASAVAIHYEEALYQVYAPLPLPYEYQDIVHKNYKDQFKLL